VSPAQREGESSSGAPVFATPPLTVLSRPGVTSGARPPIVAVVLGALGALGVLAVAAPPSPSEMGTDVRLVTPGCATW
jgi:hypothetical protein